MPVDLDDTSACPRAGACSGCGGSDELMVMTADVPMGVVCLTACWPCARGQKVPPFSSAVEAAEAVGAHCEHLGCDLDEVAAAMEQDR